MRVISAPPVGTAWPGGSTCGRADTRTASAGDSSADPADSGEQWAGGWGEAGQRRRSAATGVANTDRADNGALTEADVGQPHAHNDVTGGSICDRARRHNASAGHSNTGPADSASLLTADGDAQLERTDAFGNPTDYLADTHRAPGVDGRDGDGRRIFSNGGSRSGRDGTGSASTGGSNTGREDNVA